MFKLLVQDPILKLNYLSFYDTLCRHDQPTHPCIGLQTLIGLMLEILQTPQLLNPNPLIIPPQLTKEFHNWVKYKQWTPCINGCPCTTTPNNSTTSNGISASTCRTNARNCHYTIWATIPLLIET